MIKCELCGNAKANELEDAGHPDFKLYVCKKGFGCREWEKGLKDEIMVT